MRHSSHRVVSLIVLASLAPLVGGCQTSRSAPDGARAALDTFLDFYFHDYGSGLPDEAERATLAPQASPAFNAALEQAARAERCAQAKHHGTEPPLIQGDLFSSLFEKATGVQSIAQSRAEADSADFTVHFEYRTPGASQPETQWTDTVRMVRIGDAWRVDDVIHDGDWAFSTRGSVKSQLQAVAALCTAP